MLEILGAGMFGLHKFTGISFLLVLFVRSAWIVWRLPASSLRGPAVETKTRWVGIAF